MHPLESTPLDAVDSLAQRLHALIQRYEAQHQQHLSAAALSRGIRARSGKVSHTTIAAILNGSLTNPTLNTLREIADFFGVGVSYFIATESELATRSDSSALKELDAATDDPERAAELELLLAVKAAGVTHLGGRGLDLSVRGRQQLARLIAGAAQLSPENRDAIVQIVESMAAPPEAGRPRRE